MAKKDVNVLDLLSDEEKEGIIKGKIAVKFTEAFDAAIGAGVTLNDFITEIQTNPFYSYMSELQLGDVLTTPEEEKHVTRTRRAAVSDEIVNTIRTYLKKNPGSTVVEMVAGITDVEDDDIRRAVKKLKKDNAVKTTGEKRNTAYTLSA